MSDADLLVLDEPTSAMDPGAEAEVACRLSGLGRDRMVVIVSHRLSLVRGIAKIAVLSAGAVVEEGDHHSLMKRGGAYLSLFRAQAAVDLDWRHLA
jgi:ABC-type multidrug transport system fused ATPase/permease subunit